MKKFLFLTFFTLSFGVIGQQISNESSEVYYSIGVKAIDKSTEVVYDDSLIGESAEQEYAIGEKPESEIDTLSLNEFDDTETSQTNFERVGITEDVDSLVPTAGFTGNNSTGEQKKVALVIGNSSYRKSAKLKSPLNDANGIDSVLTKIGFDVIKIIDADLNGMRKGLSDFMKAAKNADVALFYYSGHGVQVNGENYLIPINVYSGTKEQVVLETISVETVMKISEVGSDHPRVNVLVLDACRINPFQTWSESSIGGLALVKPLNNTLISFATSPGDTVTDDVGHYSIYTGELIKQLGHYQRIEDVFINTRISVEEISDGQQSPWELTKLRGEYYLKYEH
tara:strand:+ start:1328 stop:2347 length:1020 start_codon:yes stop_codon:yes gene_type:complete